MRKEVHQLKSGKPEENWLAVVGEPLGLAGPVMCRVAEVEGRHRIVELHIGGNGRPITAAALRQLPISAMEQVMGAALRAGGGDSDAESIEVTWTLDGLEEVLKGVVAQEVTRPSSTPAMVVLYGRANGELRYVTREDPPLDWTKGQELTSDFLRLVGLAYDAAIQRGEPPAKSIAESTGASQKTVQSWVYQGRRKGVIAPAQGKGRIK